jgi:hypothetical protein
MHAHATRGERAVARVVDFPLNERANYSKKSANNPKKKYGRDFLTFPRAREATHY